MIRRFIKERRSWIFLVLSLQLLFIFVAYIDSMIPLKPTIYIVFLSAIIFSVFLIIRYIKETAFYHSLEERENNLDFTSIPEPESPFENIVQQQMINQIEWLKRVNSENSMALEQEKDDLLSWIHEVKTPLTAMHLMIERIEDKELKASLTYEWLRIHLLLDQQLHQKRISSIENDLFIEQVDVESIVIKEIKTLQTWCIQQRIGFDIHINETEVLCDAKWLAFIIRQLLTNAVKYSSQSDISITSYQQGGQTFLEVRDFGRGIDPKDLTRIFDKGFTSTTNHDDQNATGMGLYLAKKAAKSLKITILVQSILGEGTTITLTFPKRNDFVNMIGV
ncbi:sensor histidine kinase [Cytobacillus sp. IB215665]|uniref:sensor histidine kinase n=1 Tax=Cytobacillus sp. IB215665 TaxID=3097357 RepID=UPI002A106196|nr:sensor histidine kinase [Cytobacillus sp. IB215665]MDX8365375.1 sensor histidine kinase [Cytobacillus sp. IB215665]